MKLCFWISLSALLITSRTFMVGIDFNTYTSNELTEAINSFGHIDFTWAITANSGVVSTAQWNKAFAATNNQTVFSEDNPMEFRQCAAVRLYSGTLTAAFGYHQTGGVPATQLNEAEIWHYSDHCGGAGVVILTRAYWPNTDWRKRTDQVLGHPRLYGVAMEFNPDDFGKRNEVDFIHNVLAAGKTVFFLLPFRHVAGNLTEKQITSFIEYLKSHTSLTDNRIRFVLARYDKPPIPISGTTNSIYAALKAAQKLK